MYVIIGSHFVPLEGKFLLIASDIVRITLNVIVRHMPLNVLYLASRSSFCEYLIFVLNISVIVVKSCRGG
jgi:hypothetical protein